MSCALTARQDSVVFIVALQYQWHYCLQRLGTYPAAKGALETRPTDSMKIWYPSRCNSNAALISNIVPWLPAEVCITSRKNETIWVTALGVNLFLRPCPNSYTPHRTVPLQTQTHYIIPLHKRSRHPHMFIQVDHHPWSCKQVSAQDDTWITSKRQLLRGGRVLLTEMLLPQSARQGIVCLNSIIELISLNGSNLQIWARWGFPTVSSPLPKCEAPAPLPRIRAGPRSGGVETSAQNK